MLLAPGQERPRQALEAHACRCCHDKPEKADCKAPNKERSIYGSRAFSCHLQGSRPFSSSDHADVCTLVSRLPLELSACRRAAGGTRGGHGSRSSPALGGE